MENKNQTPRYTIIIHKIRIDLELSCNEYCVADIIFSLSNNPESKIRGWCWATRKSIGEFVGISERGIKEIINRLIIKGMVEKDEETKYLHTTSLWYNSVVLERLKMKNVQREESSLKGKKVPLEGEESSPSEGEESSYNNTIRYNNKDNTTSKEVGTIVKPASYGNEDINTLTAFLKEKLGGSPDGSQKDNRRFAYMLINKFKKDYPNQNNVEQIKFLIEAAQKDNFHAKNATNFKYLYYHAQQIIQSVKGRIENPKYVKI